MRNRFILGIGFLVLVISGCVHKGDPYQAVNSKQFIKFYGSSKFDQAFDFQQTADDGYIIVGAVTQFFNEDYVGDQQFYVLKVDKYGNKEWDLSLGDSNNLQDQARSVEITADGNYIVLGTKSFYVTDDSSSSYSNMFLVKLAPNGDTIWTNDQIGNVDGNETGASVKELSTGGFVLVGTTDATVPTININGAIDQYLVLTDENGDVFDFVQHGGSQDDKYVDCFVRFAGGEERIVVLGERRSTAGDLNITITTKKLSNIGGATDNESSEGGEFNDIPGRIFDAGDFALMIGTDGTSSTENASRIINYTFDGKNFSRSGVDTSISNAVWPNTLGNSVIKAWDGQSFIVLSTGENDGNTAILADMIGNNGASDPFFESQEYGLGQNSGVRIIRTSDYGYAILGNTRSGSDQKMILIKTNEVGAVE